MNLNKLAQAEVAALLLVEDRTIRNYQKETPPIPSHGSAKRLYYVWEEVLEWRDRRKYQSLHQAANARGQEAPDEKKERALLWRAQREKAELETAFRRKEALSLDDWEKALADLIVPARVNLLAIAPRLRSTIGHEAANRVEEEIKQALRDLGPKHQGG